MRAAIYFHLILPIIYDWLFLLIYWITDGHLDPDITPESIFLQTTRPNYDNSWVANGQLYTCISHIIAHLIWKKFDHHLAQTRALFLFYSIWPWYFSKNPLSFTHASMIWRVISITILNSTGGMLWNGQWGKDKIVEYANLFNFYLKHEKFQTTIHTFRLVLFKTARLILNQPYLRYLI